jgi:hypothetical protein
MSDSRVEETRKSLERVQHFDTALLPQVDQLGAQLNFQEAVAPAQRIIGLFAQFPAQYIGDLPDNQIDVLRTNADSFYSVLTEIMNFDTKQNDVFGRRTTMIDSLRGQYHNFFTSLHPLISYGASRLRDYSALEKDARAAMQAATDRADAIAAELEEHRAAAERILEDVRKTAAEQGVSQQALYFKDESKEHNDEANQWRRYTIGLSIALGVYAFLSIFLHKIPWLTPTNTYEAVQLGLSKVLIFAVMAYMLFLSARNFLSHKHNAIVNRHRQNALLTFKALVDAAGQEEKRDIVLTYAAACIFAPQETGYTKGGAQTDLPTNIFQAVPKMVASGGGH